MTLDDLGLDDERLLKAIRVIIDYNIQNNHAEELAGEGIPNPDKVMGHLRRLGLIEQSLGEPGSLDVNPVARRLIERRFQAAA